MENGKFKGHGVGKLGGLYVRVPIDLIPAFQYWLSKKVEEKPPFKREKTTDTYKKDGIKKERKKKNCASYCRALSNLFFYVYFEWVYINMSTPENATCKTYQQTTSRIEKLIGIERHTVLKHLLILVDYGILRLTIQEGKNPISIDINEEERDNMLTMYRQKSG